MVCSLSGSVQYPAARLQRSCPRVSTVTIRTLIIAALIGIAVFTSGCTGRYFHDSGRPDFTPKATLAQWPAPEYWTGIVFNGHKIGFSHLQIRPDPDPNGTFLIHSEAFFHLRFLSLDKSVYMQSIDRVDANLGLIQCRYESEIDGSRIRVEARRNGDQLEYAVFNRDAETRQTLMLEENARVYPASAIGLVPMLQGLAIGRSYTYLVFDPQVQGLQPVSQNITAYERSDLFDGAAFRIQSRYQGQLMTTWMDERGRPLLEMSMGGTFIAVLEDEKTARSYLTRAALSKEESLLNYSLIPTAVPLAATERLHALTLLLQGLPETFSVPTDRRQQCLRRGMETQCRITSQDHPANPDDAADTAYLKPTVAINTHHPRIEQAARQAVGETATDRERIEALVGWMQRHIRPEAVDVYSALDVLEGGRAECPGHALLFAAMARTLGIPTRVVNGIVYSNRHQGFLYHSWNECLVENRWLSVDPIWGQIPADVTHLKLIEGHALQELAPLMEIIGKLSIQIQSAH